jgi:hypothetical protein
MEEKKRIHFPWVRKKQGRVFKTMLAVFVDRNIVEVKSGKLKHTQLYKMSVENAISKFPSMYKMVAEFYEKHGRLLSEKNFRNLCYSRIIMMFDYDKGTKDLVKCPEHPENAEVLKKHIPRCIRMIRKKLTWEQYLDAKNKTPKK